MKRLMAGNVTVGTMIFVMMLTMVTGIWMGGWLGEKTTEKSRDQDVIAMPAFYKENLQDNYNCSVRDLVVRIRELENSKPACK